MRREQLIRMGVTAVGLSGIAAVLLIFLFVVKEALPLQATLRELFGPVFLREGRPAGFSWQPVSRIPKLSMVPLWVGTLKISVVAMATAMPIGIASALFCAEFAGRKAREWLKPAIELLAAIPSVVVGFFVVSVWATPLQRLLDLDSRMNATLAGFGLAVALVPVIFTVSEDALNSVPRSLREASLALGATRWETAWKVVLPAAAPGVLAACVLGMGRAVGETMIVLMASGNAAIVSWSLASSARTLSATIAAEMGEVVVGSNHAAALFFVGVQLFALTLALNSVARLWIRRFARQVQGGGR